MKKLIGLYLVFFTNIAFVAPDIQTAEGRGLEHARLESERTAINSKFDALDRECQTRFVVTSCREDVKVQRIRGLDALTRQETILNDMDRKAAAAKQQKKLDEKTSVSALAEKEKNRQDALADSARRAAERDNKNLEKDREATSSKASTRADSKAASKAPSLSDQERATKRAAYEEKQQELAKRIQRRDEGLRDLAEKQKARDAEAAAKAAKTAKAESAANAASAAKP